VTVDGGEFRVERLDGRRIDRVRYTPNPDPDVEGAAQ
jgi:CBS domain containing-hemolysin-like protein